MTLTADLFDKYAQKTVDDMDIETLMNIVKEDIENRLEDLPLSDALLQIRESVYGHELKGDIERLEAASA